MKFINIVDLCKTLNDALFSRTKSCDFCCYNFYGSQVFVITSSGEQRNCHYMLNKTYVTVVARGLVVCGEATVRLPSRLPRHLAFLTLVSLDPDA